MSELNELYQQVILDHNKSPKNYKECEGCNHSSEGYNPLCGDHIYIHLKVEDDIIKDITFTGIGCAISKASASLMTSALKGKTKKEAEELFEKFHKLVTSDTGDEQNIEGLGKLMVFSGVREFPMRVKCASLAWHTMLSALKEQDKTSTE